MAEQPQLPRVYTTAILAGERSGSLSGVLDYYINYQRITAGFRRRLLASLIYPALLVVASISIVLYMVTYVLPQFARLYQDLNIPLPLTTRILTTVAIDYRWWFLGIVLALFLSLVGLGIWSRTLPGGLRVDRWKLKLPLVGDTWLKFQVAQFSRTLATLLTGGTPLVNALETASEAITSRLVSSSVYQAAQRVREGQSLHSALVGTGLMPEVALEMVEVGEATGALAPMLNSVAEFYEEDVNLRLGAAINLINPVILILMALIVGFILISLYLPIFSFSIGGGIPAR
jgi:type IV pilus assembly protein PilC